jgi:hypothetical protein
VSEVQESECGVVGPTHIKGVQRTMQEENAFLFLRPTELDSTRLIRAGYATKSMDIHDKSSNWGPMAGFVPCDPAFSKLAEGQPDPTKTGFDHMHGEAYPVQLFLTDELVTTFIKDGKIAQVRPAEKFAQIGRGDNRYFKAGAAMPTGPKSTLFALSKAGNDWLVWWNQGKEFHPLFVWGYLTDGKLVPVTGDYDMWMVAPHVTSWTRHGGSDLVTDPHGESAASLYTTVLIRKMNQACGRSGNPVFNHGAEAQNYGFTQKLDARVAMFTAKGTSRMIEMTDMPKVLADLQNAGYLVLWNRRYGESDAHLSGKADPAVEQTRSNRDAMLAVMREIRATVDPEKRTRLKQSKAEFARQIEPERLRIIKFHEKLSRLMQSDDVTLKALKADDFPGGYQPVAAAVRGIQQRLQKAVVGGAKGQGETDAASLGDWYYENLEDLAQLSRYWRERS